MWIKKLKITFTTPTVNSIVLRISDMLRKSNLRHVPGELKQATVGWPDAGNLSKSF